MKTTTLFALAALGLSTSALAQTAPPVGQPPQSPVVGKHAAKRKHEGKHLSPAVREKIDAEALAKMNLPADQVAKLEAHEAQSDEKRAALKSQGKEAKKAARKAGVKGEGSEPLKALKKSDKLFMKQTLTKSQIKEFARLRKEGAKAYEAKGAAPATKP